ncbi:MAG: carbon-nitrogen hydrolase family protein [Zestosphaera sp.]
MRRLRVGILQFSSLPSKNETLSKLSKLIKNVTADVVVLPEYAAYNIVRLRPEEAYAAADGLEGDFIKFFSNLAREYSTYFVVTTFEKSPVPPKVYNTAVVIKPDGEVASTYRKTHLFDAYGYRESDYMMRGENVSPVVDVGKAKIAVAICFDIRFPELFRIYALNGAEVVVVPSAWFAGPLKEETLSFLARARAHENTIYVVVAVQYGNEYTGRSLIADPWGTQILDLGIGEKYHETDINIELVYEVRKKLPVLQLRRTDLYCPELCSKNSPKPESSEAGKY